MGNLHTLKIDSHGDAAGAKTIELDGFQLKGVGDLSVSLTPREVNTAFIRLIGPLSLDLVTKIAVEFDDHSQTLGELLSEVAEDHGESIPEPGAQSVAEAFLAKLIEQSGSDHG